MSYIEVTYYACFPHTHTLLYTTTLHVFTYITHAYFYSCLNLSCFIFTSILIFLHILYIQYITQIAYILIRWIHAFTVHTFYNVYTALLPYSYFVYFININSFYVPKYNAKFKTTLWNKSTKHKKELGCHWDSTLAINKL